MDWAVCRWYLTTLVLFIVMNDYGLRISRLELAAFDGAGVALLFVKVGKVFLKDLVALVYGPRTVTITISFSVAFSRL